MFRLIALFMIFPVFSWGSPSKTSGLHGFDGIQIISESEGVCLLRFPEGYGMKMSELQILLAMANNEIRHDVGCMAPPAYWALDQMVKISIKYDFQETSEIILHEDFTNLGPGISEEFSKNYQLPVLMGYSGAQSLLGSSEESRKNIAVGLAQSYCMEWSYNEKKYRNLVSSLKDNGLAKLANALRELCEKELKHIRAQESHNRAKQPGTR